MNSLEEAKEFLRENYEDGAECPCCGQFVKLYGRQVTSSMAYALILVYKYFEKHPDEEWLHVKNYLNGLNVPVALKDGGDFAKLQLWGLVKQMEGEREDGSRRNGYYKITEAGKEFVKGIRTVPTKLYLYNGKVIDIDHTPSTIQMALKKKFNYEELMKDL